MITFTANDAKQKFGEVIDEALQGPVSITKHNRRSVVIMSDAEYRNLSAAKLDTLKAELKAGFDQLDRGEFSTRTADEIAEEVLQEHLAEDS